MRRAWRLVVILGLALVLGVAAHAQWQVVYLHPEGANSSNVVAAAGAQQGGRIEVLDDYIYNYHPVIWNASADDYIDLLPDGWRTGVVSGMDGPWQVGYVASQFNQPALWSGSSESMVILTPGGVHPAGGAVDVAADQQVGYAAHIGEGEIHAALWYGSAESFVDLNPPVARSSAASATDGVRQGGWGNFPAAGQIHAVLWDGTAESFIDMHPEGAYESVILGMADGVQVGWARFPTGERAAVWRGSPDTYVELHPPGGLNSRLYDTTGTVHAGYTSFTGWAEAGIWTADDAESFENLHIHLSPDWFVSGAHAVCVHDGWLYVGGAAARTPGRAEAILWMRRIPRAGGSPKLVLPERVSPVP